MVKKSALKIESNADLHKKNKFWRSSMPKQIQTKEELKEFMKELGRGERNNFNWPLSGTSCIGQGR